MISDIYHLFIRQVRATLRMPLFLLLSIVQPIMWLIFFGQLFGRIVDIPGFEGESYVNYLGPGVAVMSAMFGSSFSGIAILLDMERGVLDRMLVTPVSRLSLIFARVIHSSVTVCFQILIILAMAYFLGAAPKGGVLSLAAVMLSGAILALGVSAASHSLALVSRRQEVVIAAMNFLTLPLLFTSSLFIQHDLMPSWIQTVSSFNPVNWAVGAARAGYQAQDWSWVGLQLLFLSGFSLMFCLVATRAFERYRASL